MFRLQIYPPGRHNCLSTHSLERQSSLRLETAALKLVTILHTHYTPRRIGELSALGHRGLSFLTTLPHALTQTINYERSPIILTEEEQFQRWLCGTPAEAFSRVQTFDAERMRIGQEGFEKRDLLAA